MATPNIVNVATINAKNATGAVTTSRAVAVDVSADKVAKTKPSKHTNKFKQMYGEDYLNEKIKGLETKAKKSGMPYSILKKVYDRGMAAWKGGHRPGTTPQQWAFARVNSFTTKSSGTWGKADKDLAKQVRGS